MTRMVVFNFVLELYMKKHVTLVGRTSSRYGIQKEPSRVTLFG